MMSRVLAMISALLITATSQTRGETMNQKIILMNPFHIKAAESEYFKTRWLAVADYMKRQPGFISAKLHQGVNDSSAWFNYAEWRSVDDFRKAIQSDEFKRLTKNFPGEGGPELYRLDTQLEVSGH